MLRHAAVRRRSSSAARDCSLDVSTPSAAASSIRTPSTSDTEPSKRTIMPLHALWAVRPRLPTTGSDAKMSRRDQLIEQVDVLDQVSVADEVVADPRPALLS